MKGFIKYTFSVCLLVALFSTLYFSAINVGLRKQKTDYFGKLNEMILGKENFDIIFLGSSRVNWGINPKIIDSITHKNSFNFGLDGAYIVEDWMNLRAYLASHPKPRLVVLNIDPRFLNARDEIKTPARYLPYLDHHEIYDTLSRYSSWPVVAKYMPFVGASFYTDGIVNQSLQAFIAPNRKKENYYKGFSPLEKVWSNGEDLESLLAIDCTEKGLSLFRNFLKEMKENNLRLDLIYSPQYFVPADDKKHLGYMTVLNAIAGEYGYSVRDYSHWEICHEKKYFFDATHLNLTGANLFSEKLAADLNVILNTVDENK